MFLADFTTGDQTLSWISFAGLIGALGLCLWGGVRITFIDRIHQNFVPTHLVMGAHSNAITKAHKTSLFNGFSLGLDRVNY
jgi:hypothetical protein